MGALLAWMATPQALAAGIWALAAAVVVQTLTLGVWEIVKVYRRARQQPVA